MLRVFIKQLPNQSANNFLRIFFKINLIAILISKWETKVMVRQAEIY